MITCVGLITCDIAIHPTEAGLFQREATQLDTLKINAGGDALNVACNLGKLGVPTALIGCASDDMSGDVIRKTAVRHHVDITGLVDKGLPTSTSIVLVGDDGERHFAYYPGGNPRLSFEDIDTSLVDRSSIVHISSAMALDGLDIGGGGEKLFRYAHERGILTSLDLTVDSTLKLWMKRIEKLLYHTDIFLPSYDEAVMITGENAPEKMADCLKNFGIKVFAVKLGGEGCFVTDFITSFRTKAIKSPVVDTTGAGDSFVAGFLYGLLKDCSLKDCSRIACAMGSSCVQNFGTLSHTVSETDILNIALNTEL